MNKKIKSIKMLIWAFLALTLLFGACSDDSVESSEEALENKTEVVKATDEIEDSIIEEENDELDIDNGIYKLNIVFEKMSHDIRIEDEDTIREFANYLIKRPTYKTEIKAYTDSYGSAKYNLKISKKRAKSVYYKLIEFGVKSDRIEYEGMGKKSPIASNRTEEGRAKNRRVEAVIIK